MIDMDGVICRGGEVIPGAIDLVERLVEHRAPFLFLTNNSQRTARDVAVRLRKMGFPLDAGSVLTSAMVTAQFVARQTPGGRAYVIGEGGLLQALHQHGYAIVDSDPDYVIVGEGRAITLEMLETAVRLVMAGARLIATNLDPVCPTSNGFRPGCGALVKIIETATDTRAFSVGKPSPWMFRAALKELGLRADETTMIGDTMDTDILGGAQMGCRTVLVLTGGTRRVDLVRFACRPDIVVESVADLLHPDVLALESLEARAGAESLPPPGMRLQ